MSETTQTPSPWPAQVREQVDDLPPSVQVELRARLTKRGITDPMAPEHLAVVVEVAERLGRAYDRKRMRSREAATKKRQLQKTTPAEQPPAQVPADPPEAPASVEAPTPAPEAVHTLAANLVEALEITAPGLEPPQLVRQHTRAPKPAAAPKKEAPAVKPNLPGSASQSCVGLAPQSGVAQALAASGKHRLFA